jgi:hypothetical protein
MLKKFHCKGLLFFNQKNLVLLMYSLIINKISHFLLMLHHCITHSELAISRRESKYNNKKYWLITFCILSFQNMIAVSAGNINEEVRSDAKGVSIKINGIKTNKQVKFIRMNINKLNTNKFENYENALLFENFRIFYTNHGEHALLDKFKSDLNNNNVPDFVEDVLTEIVVTKKLLDSFGFDLLNNKNSLYAHLGVKYIDVFISNNHKPHKKSAFYFGFQDKLNYKVLDKNNIAQDKSILMRVHQPGRRLKKSVPHELFHAYQIANTKLLNRWLVEGSAVWFEHALSKGVGSDKPLPKTIESLNNEVTSKAYKASFFWNRLAKLCSNNNQFIIPASIKTKAHYLLYDQQLIFSDNLLYGIDFMIAYIAELNEQDDLVTTKYRKIIKNLDRYFWLKPLRKSENNNLYMLNALKNTIVSQCSNYGMNNELTSFVTLLDKSFSNSQVDSEDNLTLGWKVEGKKIAGAKISKVYDQDSKKNVIEFAGSGMKSGYRFLKNQLNDTNSKLVSFDIKSTEKFAIYIKVKTKHKLSSKDKSKRILVYSNTIHDTSLKKAHYYKNFKLIDKKYRDGSWNTLIRNLNTDLQLSEPENEVLSIIDIYTRGNFRISNLLFLNNKKTSSIINNLSFQYKPDSKCVNDIDFARNIWDMKLFENRIYIGTGNSRNIAPSCNAGPVPIIIFKPSNDSFNFEYLASSYIGSNKILKKEKTKNAFIKEEKINRFLTINNNLIIPGHDPTQNWSFGNFYLKDKNSWIQYRTIKNAVHNFDMAYFDNKLFAAIGIYKNKKFKPTVAISDDFGKNWTYQDIIRNGSKVYNLLKVGNRLFATTLFSNQETVSASEYIQGNFIGNKSLNRDFFFPETDFVKNKKILINKKLYINNNLTLYLGSYAGNAHQPKTLGLYKIENKQNEIYTSKINTNESRILDFVKYQDMIYLLTDKYDDGIYHIKVITSQKDDLTSWAEAASFYSRNIIRAFEVTKDYLYLGIGIELDEKNNYFSNSVKSDIGDLLKIKI